MSLSVLLLGVALPWLIVALFVILGCWVGLQLVHQNGRILARLEALDRRADLPGRTAFPSNGTAGAEMPLPDPVYGRILMRLEALEQRLGAADPLPAPEAPPGLPLGTPAPEFELPDLKGQRRSLAEFRGRKVLLVFFNPRCGFCTQMASDLAALPAAGAGDHPVPLIVTTGDKTENRKLVEEYGIRCPVLLQEQMQIASLYQVSGTPIGYLIDENGRIASEIAVGAQALLALAPGPAAPANGRNGYEALGGKRSLDDSKIQRNGLPVGTPAPSFRLPRLDGGELTLKSYRGRQVLLVFSDPNCGPCDQFASQLEALSQQTPSVQLLMVSRGDAEANRLKVAEHRLTFPVVLQRQWEISRDYAMFGTPIAYLIDEKGRVAADVAVGVEPILNLLRSAAGPSHRESKLKRCPCGKPEGQCDCGRRTARLAGGSQHGP